MDKKKGTHHKTGWVWTDPAAKPAQTFMACHLNHSNPPSKRKMVPSKQYLNNICSHQCQAQKTCTSGKDMNLWCDTFKREAERNVFDVPKLERSFQVFQILHSLLSLTD